MRVLLFTVLALCGCRPSDPCAKLSPLELDFGEVEPGLSERQVVMVTSSAEGLISVQAEPVAAPFGADAREIVVVPRSTESTLRSPEASIAFTFTPGFADGREHFATSVVRQEGCADQLVQLHGTGAGGLSVARVLDFGVVPVGTPTRRALTLINSRRTGLTVTVSVSSPFVGAASSVTVPPVSTLELEVAVIPQRAGDLTGSVLVLPALTGAKAQEVSLLARAQ